MRSPSYTLAELAAEFGLLVHGDAGRVIHGICALAPGKPGALSFLTGAKRAGDLATTQASAVIVAPSLAGRLAGDGLIADEPQVAFARIAALFDVRRHFAPGIAEQASVADGARIGYRTHIGPYVVVEAGASIGDGCYIGPGCVIGAGASIGAGSRLEARVTVAADCVVGARASIESGAVIGSRGFGNALGREGWTAVPQLGRVVIGDDVEIGAGTTIDRGAIEDTVIENNVRLDNLVQVAHNCHIGAHTAIAACTGIAGSTRVGRRCMIGGAVGIGGHLQIADDVVVLGGSMVSGSIRSPGMYGSAIPVMEAGDYRRTVARLRRLGLLEARVKGVERLVGQAPEQDTEE